MEVRSVERGSNHSGSNLVNRAHEEKRGFDFEKYYGLFFDQLPCVFDPSACDGTGSFVRASMD